MLGLYPIGSRAISSGPFGLIAVPALLAATATITFAVSGRIGAVTPISATVAGPVFAVSGNWIVRQAISATVTIAFDGSPLLRVAGKPIQINAVPQSYNVRADYASYTLKASPESFTLRGVR
jgi:hypothetical protein